MVRAMSAALPVLHLGGTLAQAITRVQLGQNEADVARAEADQYLRRGMMSRAIGSLQAQRLMRANQRIRGRQDAVLAASGFSATDPGAQAIVGETVSEMSIQELLAVTQAEQEARNDEYRAQLRRTQGREARAAGFGAAGLALVSGAASWRERFGSPDPEALDESDGGDAIPYAYEDPRIDPYHRAP